MFCERLAQTLVRKFEKKEEEIRAITRKLDERKRLQVEKKEKRNRDKTEKEKAKRHLENDAVVFEMINSSCILLAHGLF